MPSALAGESCIKKMELFDFITKSDSGLGTYDGIPNDNEEDHVKNTFEIIDDVFACLEISDTGDDPAATCKECFKSPCGVLLARHMHQRVV